MVLIAVAIMLGMWGLYALTSGSDDSGDSQNAAGTGTDATINAPVEGENGAGQAQPGAKPDEQNGEKPGEANAEGDKPGDNPGEKPGDKPEEKPEAKPGENGANTGAARPQAEIPVNVFNNSGQANYAAEESEKLKDAHFKVAEVGNISDQVMVVPRTTVYFPAGDANAENLAKEVAARYYGANVPAEAVAAYPQELSAEYTKDNAVVVVLAVPQA